MIVDTHTHRNKKNQRRVLLLSVCAVLLIAFLVSLYVSNTCIKITHHTLESEKVTSPVRLAVISDLHSKRFAKDNADLYAKIEQSDPDLILTVGDMISDDRTDAQGIRYIKEVLSRLCEIAPVYCSLGNQERRTPTLENIKDSLKESGAVLLEQDYEDITINGNNFRVLGLSYYRFWDTEANCFLADHTGTEPDTFTLLLCHNPEFYQWGIKDYPIDLTVSGHTHGGMLKIPLIGPVYAPEQGWFPKYAAGFYPQEKGYLAVTTGLGSSPEYMPRIFNRPEIMIIDVK